MTAVIQIGNSDDKLSQRRWANFVGDVNMIVRNYASQVHFFGAPFTTEVWQNAAWIFEVSEYNLSKIHAQLTDCRKLYEQDSIALTTGETTFI